ncbi:hypothetical protein [Arthrobacter sp. NPDC056727]|uniref:hypothetical protein n=1 Tax=Arthrobacter sp. NPDC056727 TaxID=3345927 RepID=UPI00366CD396
MSNPPVPHSNDPGSNEPDNGSQPANGQPRYGQDAPQYGQNTPQYGQGSQGTPQYGQNAPQYGQNPPKYGQAGQGGAPQYGQSPYGQNAPQYGQAQYGQPQNGQSPYGQPPYGQSPYGQSPYGQYPSEQTQAASQGVRPPQVDLAFWLIIAAGVLSGLSALVLAFTGRDTFMAMMEEEAARQGQALPPGSTEMLQSTVVAGSIIGAIVTLGLYALVAFPVRKGKNWARILGTVFAAISLFGLFGGSFALGPVYGIIQILVILLGAAGIVLLYLPANSPYFQKPQPFANPYSQPGPYGR